MAVPREAAGRLFSREPIPAVKTAEASAAIIKRSARAAVERLRARGNQFISRRLRLLPERSVITGNVMPLTQLYDHR